MFRTIWLLLSCVLLTGLAAASTPAEAQTRATNGARAKIYVILPRGLTGSLIGFDVTVDDKKIGNVTAGSYVSVDRPAGRHTVAIKPLVPLADAVHKFHAAAGRSYYFVVNTKSSTTAVVSGSFVMAIPLPGTSVGRPVSERNFMSGIYLGQLDDAAGRAMLASLKKQ